MKTREELVKIFNDVREQINEIDNAKRKQEDAHLVGRYFVYENRYSSGESWPLYIYVYEMSDNAVLLTKQFQVTSDNKIEFEISNFYCRESCKEISREDFASALSDAFYKIEHYFDQ